MITEAVLLPNHSFIIDLIIEYHSLLSHCMLSSEGDLSPAASVSPPSCSLPDKTSSSRSATVASLSSTSVIMAVLHRPSLTCM